MAALARAALLSLPVGLLAALPGALRAANGGAPLLLAWLALAGSSALLVGPLLWALWRARLGHIESYSLPLGLLLALGPLTRFGALLFAKTHHRPLGAVTFAVLALFAVLGSWAVAARLLAGARAASSSLGARLWLAPLVLGCSFSVLIWVPALAAGVPGGALLDCALLGGLLLVAAYLGRGALGARTERLPPALGLGLWVGVVGAGLGCVALVPELGGALRHLAPVPLGLGAVLGA